MRSDRVPCPKCKGGCDLCGGIGSVPPAAARVWVREETRATVKVERRGFSEEELPTKPSFIRQADRRKRMVRIAALLILGAVIGIGLGVATALFFR